MIKQLFISSERVIDYSVEQAFLMSLSKSFSYTNQAKENVHYNRSSLKQIFKGATFGSVGFYLSHLPYMEISL